MIKERDTKMKTKLKQIDKTVCILLRDAITKACEEMGEEFNVVVRVGNATFSKGHVIFKVECNLVDDNGHVHTKAEEDFVKYSALHGLPSDSLGKIFSLFGKDYKLVGYKPQAYKYPFVGKCVITGKKFKFTQSLVDSAFKQRC